MNQWISDGITIAGMIAIIGFLWNLRSDMHREISGLRDRMAKFESDMTRQISDLRERMARLEGLFEGFTKSKEPS